MQSYLRIKGVTSRVCKKPEKTQPDPTRKFRALQGLDQKNPEISIQTQPKKAQSFWPRLKPNPTQSIRTENKPNPAQPEALGQKLNPTRPIASIHNPKKTQTKKKQDWKPFSLKMTSKLENTDKS